MHESPDPRPMFHRVLAQTGRIIDAVEPDQAARPTPCDEMDVQALVAHTIWALQRVTAVAGGASADTVPAVSVAPDTWSRQFADAVDAAEAAWSDPSLLDTIITLPFTTVPGRVVVSIYTMEMATHGWDLARACGQAAELDPDIATAALATATVALPPGARPSEVPFADEVAVGSDAGPYDRLVAYLGRRP